MRSEILSVYSRLVTFEYNDKEAASKLYYTLRNKSPINKDSCEMTPVKQSDSHTL